MNNVLSVVRAAARVASTVGLLAIGTQAATAAVVATGCAGGSFGAACGLDELLAGGTLTVDGYRFSDFALTLNGGRLPTASSIRIDGLDVPSAPGLTFVDTGPTWRSLAGDLTSANLSFDVDATAGARPVIGASLIANVGGVTGTGSYTYVFGDLFASDFTSFLGSLADSCDAATCSGGTATSAATFAGATSFALAGGVDVGAGANGSAQLNGFSLTLTPSAVPEPGTVALLMLGAVGLSLSRRRPSAGAFAIA